MQVRDVMHAGVTWFTPTTPIRDIARAMLDEDIGAVPIAENDRLIGMVTDRDIVVRGIAAGGDCLKMLARDVMSKSIIYCYDDDDVQHAVRAMEKHHVRRLPAINREKRLVGMLSLGDISMAGREVVGEAIRATSAHHA